MSFPEGFVWGTACAAYQCEGAWNIDGKGPNIWDDFCHAKDAKNIKNGDSGDVACDCYHLYKEDIKLMKQLGVKAYRFSLDWARILPQGVGAVNEAGLKYYENLIDELIKNGIEPWVTLYHWELPSALEEKGGWLARETVEAFENYARIVGERFSGRIKKYMTINEPQCAAMLGYGIGVHAPGKKLPKEYVLKIMHHLVLAHAVGMRALKAASKTPVEVGTVTCGSLCYTNSNSEKAIEAVDKASFALSDENWVFTHNIYLDPIFFGRYDVSDSAPEFIKRFSSNVPEADWTLLRASKPDFLGLNIYNGDEVDEDGKRIKRYPGFPLTAVKWPVTPKALHYGPSAIARRYPGLPIYITENGLSCNDRVYQDGKVHDLERIDFLDMYLKELENSIADGSPIKGYLHWSFLDNFEWGEGYDERFGIVYVDYRDQKRTLKDSALWFAKVIESNGECL